MSTVNTEELHYDTQEEALEVYAMQEEGAYAMQEEGSVPTVLTADDRGDLSLLPSMDDLNQQQPNTTILLDMKVMHAIQDIITGNNHDDAKSAPDGMAEAAGDGSGSVVSHASLRSWISKEMANSKGLTFFTATCTAFSMSGASVYLPWAFAQGGTLLTSIILGAALLAAYITSGYLLEASARAQALEFLKPDGSLPAGYIQKIRERKYELSLLTKIFLGKAGTLFFSLTTLFSMYGYMWAYCTIFANSFADKFPLGDMEDGGYKIYIALFMVVSVPLACTSITDQQWIQVLFVTARFVMVLLMLGTVGAAYASNEPHFGEQVGPVNDVGLAMPSSIVQVTMTCIFASLFQFSVPTMAMESRSKTVLSKVFATSATLSYVSNLLLGILLALFFGQNQPDSANLNWVNYHGGTGDGDPAWWATAISSYIVVSTAIHMIPQYSLVVLPTAGILMGVVYGDRVHEVEKDWKLRTVFRLLASIPPAFGALFLSDFSVIAKYTGTFTILSYTVCPALLALKSRSYMNQKNLPLTTYYSSHFSSPLWSYGLLLLSAAVIVGVALEWIPALE
jgi:hypothetical protein